ncbi:hypothetical protein ACVB8X_42765 [Streptomyces sp. NRAIS4]
MRLHHHDDDDEDEHDLAMRAARAYKEAGLHGHGERPHGWAREHPYEKELRPPPPPLHDAGDRGCRAQPDFGGGPGHISLDPNIPDPVEVAHAHSGPEGHGDGHHSGTGSPDHATAAGTAAAPADAGTAQAALDPSSLDLGALASGSPAGEAALAYKEAGLQGYGEFAHGWAPAHPCEPVVPGSAPGADVAPGVGPWPDAIGTAATPAGLDPGTPATDTPAVVAAPPMPPVSPPPPHPDIHAPGIPTGAFAGGDDGSDGTGHDLRTR